MMKLIEKLGQTSTEPFLFSQDFLESIRNLLLIKIAGQTPIIDLPDSEYQALQKLAQSTSEEDIHLLFDMTLKGCQDIQKAQDPKIVLDIVLLRLLSAPRVVNLAQLLNGVQSGVAFTNAAGKTNPNALGNASLEQKKNSKPPFIDEKLPPAERWLKLSAHIKEADSLLGSKIENVLFLGLKEKELQLGVPQKLQYLKELLQDKNVLQKMQNFIDTFWGTGFTISVNQGVNTDAGQSAQMMTQQKEQKRRDEMKTLVLDHPLVKTAQKIFSGQVKEIKETT